MFQVFPIEHLQIFAEEELEHLLCGEHDSLVVCILSLCCSLFTWCTHYIYEVVVHSLYQFNELLDHVKFDHGYTASSLPIVNVSVLTSFIYPFVN